MKISQNRVRGAHDVTEFLMFELYLVIGLIPHHYVEQSEICQWRASMPNVTQIGAMIVAHAGRKSDNLCMSKHTL